MDSIRYYNENAPRYISETFQSDISAVRNKFLSYIPEGGKILDAGCGSGRDLISFKESGYYVRAMDGSAAMVEHCRTIAGDIVELSDFQSYNTDIRFDGIWACASLLHLDKDDLLSVLKKFRGFLSENGHFFMSFKYGSDDYVKDNRYFNCQTPESMAELLSNLKDMEIIESFITSDVREGRSGEKWVNVIIRKRSLNKE